MSVFAKNNLWEVSALLSSVAMGRVPADTVIRNANLVQVTTREVLEHTDIAITAGRIALVGDASDCIGPDTEVIDAGGQYLAPGFLDGHIHVESSMLSVGEYARAVIPHGTTGIYMDPHEICNVLGVPGVLCMIEDAKRTPLKAMVTMPSCVPAVPGFEDAGAAIGSADIREAMKNDYIVGLGEMMNFPGILSSDEETHRIVGETLKAGKTVTGHFSIPDTGKALSAYVATGIRCCHESTSAAEALAKMRLGMYAQIREGSAWHDLHDVSKALTENTIDSRFACLVSDDAHPNTLISQGHLDHILRRAVEEGIDVLTAIQMLTINTAQCFGMDDEIGAVAPGKCADIVFLDNLTDLRVTRVLINGKTVARDGKILYTPVPYVFPDFAVHTMHIKGEITPASFRIPAPTPAPANVRVIEVIPARVGTREKIFTVTPEDGAIRSDTARDLLKAFVFERHHATGKFSYGLVRGFGIKKGAMASTVAHDAHNLLVVGTNDEDMSLAANALIEAGGGMVVVSEGKILGLVKLPVAGLMNDGAAEDTARDVEALEGAWQQIGCSMPSPFMTMALIPLACLPELRLTDRGLVDCNTFRFTDFFAD
ncbi:MAG: adenine deaminase [Fusobacteriaceae bacterium]|nr:adenine deaminase [Fusobacteriaceae bacterium]